MAKTIPFEAPDTVPTELLGERCDRCGARALHRVVLRTGELFFCDHHRTQYSDALAGMVKIPRHL